MNVQLDRIFASRDLRANPLIILHVVMATRLSLLFARAGRDPLPDMAVRLRSMRAAQDHQALMGAINQLWPESFTIHRPCCMTMSPDEMLLADVATAALHGDAGGAMDAMRDLLPCMARDRLFGHMVQLVDSIRAAQQQQPSDAADLA